MLGLIVTAGSAINLIFTFVLGIANDVFGCPRQLLSGAAGAARFFCFQLFHLSAAEYFPIRKLFGKSVFQFSTKELLYVYHIV